LDSWSGFGGIARLRASGDGPTLKWGYSARNNQEEQGAAAKEGGEEEGAAAKARGERQGAEAKELGEREGDDAKFRGNGHNSAPELDPTALGSGILMLAGGVLLLSERRRQKR
jgi:hypothetical protein